MAILFRCKCGKKLQTEDEFAGRQLHCPGCTRIMTIPTPGRVGARRADFVRFACSCGKKMKSLGSDAGGLVECPSCGKEHIIPQPDLLLPASPAFDTMARTAPRTTRTVPVPMTTRTATVPLETRPAPATMVSMDPAPVPAPAPRSSAPAPQTPLPVKRGHPGPIMSQDTLTVQHSAPWRDEESRRSSGPPPREQRVKPLPWLLLLALIAAALIAAEWFIAPRIRAGSRPAIVDINEFSLIPPDAVEVVSIHYASLRDHPQRQKDSAALQYAANLLKGFAWNENDIDRVTLIWMPDPTEKREANKAPEPEKKDKGKAAKKGKGKAPPPPVQSGWQWNDHHCLIVRTRTSLSDSDVLQNVQSATKDLLTGHAVYKRTMHKNAKGDKAFYVAGAKVLVISTVPGMERFLRLQSGGKHEHPLAGALAAADQHDVVIGLNLTHTVVQVVQDVPNPIAATNFRTAVLTLDEGREEGKREPTAELRMAFANQQAAEKAPTPAGWNKKEITGNTAVVQVVGNAKAVDDAWINLANFAKDDPHVEAK